MRILNHLLTTILLILILPGITAATATANALHQTSVIPFFHHPLIYRPASSSTPGAPPYVPSDIYQGYDYGPLYKHGIKGNGTRIAIVDAFGDPKMSQDLASFDSLTGLPSTTLSTYYPDGIPTGSDSGWAVETALDVEWVHAIAPAASIDIVVAFDSSLAHVYDAINLVATRLTTETALSMSFGLSESGFPTTGPNTIAAHHALFTTITSHGTMIFSSSGDNGATVCCDPSYPASDPLVVSVGGTTLNLDSSANYVSEDTWSGSGAGSSSTFTKPSWQTGIGDTMRDSVDVSYDADPNTGVVVIEGNRQFQVGGTSAGSPQWAALAALASQANNKHYGALNPFLYNLTSYHDITTGNDGFFSAAKGWDYPTGLGSPNAALVVSNLAHPSVSLHDAHQFQGLTVSTTANLIQNSFSPTVSGIASITATNTTTGVTVFSKNYTLTDLRLQNMTMGQTTRVLLNIPANPYPLSSDLTLTIQGTTTTTAVVVTRQVNISASGTVNINDVTIVMAQFDKTPGMTGYNPQADLAITGQIGITDVTIAELYYGSPAIN